jgi:hypothetical protein
VSTVDRQINANEVDQERVDSVHETFVITALLIDSIDKWSVDELLILRLLTLARKRSTEAGSVLTRSAATVGTERLLRYLDQLGEHAVPLLDAFLTSAVRPLQVQIDALDSTQNFDPEEPVAVQLVTPEAVRVVHRDARQSEMSTAAPVELTLLAASIDVAAVLSVLQNFDTLSLQISVLHSRHVRIVETHSAQLRTYRSLRQRRATQGGAEVVRRVIGAWNDSLQAQELFLISASSLGESLQRIDNVLRAEAFRRFNANTARALNSILLQAERQVEKVALRWNSLQSAALKVNTVLSRGDVFDENPSVSPVSLAIARNLSLITAYQVYFGLLKVADTLRLLQKVNVQLRQADRLYCFVKESCVDKAASPDAALVKKLNLALVRVTVAMTQTVPEFEALASAADAAINELQQSMRNLLAPSSDKGERFQILLQVAQTGLATSRLKCAEQQLYAGQKVERLVFAQSELEAMMTTYATPRLVHRSDLLGLVADRISPPRIGLSMRRTAFKLNDSATHIASA